MLRFLLIVGGICFCFLSCSVRSCTSSVSSSDNHAATDPDTSTSEAAVMDSILQKASDLDRIAPMYEKVRHDPHKNTNVNPQED